MQPGVQRRLRDLLPQALFLVEHINGWLANHARKGRRQSFHQAAIAAHRQLVEGSSGWLRVSDFLRACAEAGLVPEPQPQILEGLLTHLVQPASATLEAGSGIWKLRGRPALGMDELPREWSEPAFYYDLCGGGVGHSTVLVDFLQLLETSRSAQGIYCEEFLDPFPILEGIILERRPDATVEFAKGLIQRWLRGFFGIKFSYHSKYFVGRLAGLLNKAYYGTRHPRLSGLNMLSSSGTISLTALVELVERAMGEEVERYATFEAIDRQLAKRWCALGYVAFLRFCKLFRARYKWLALPQTRQGTSSLKFDRLSLSLLRPVESEYFAAKMFGVLTEVGGLNFVFRERVSCPRHRRGGQWYLWDLLE